MLKLKYALDIFQDKHTSNIQANTANESHSFSGPGSLQD